MMKTTRIAVALAAALALPAAARAQDCMLGEIKMFAGNFEPRNYMFAHGQLLPIAQNTALFSILGTTYGGDGQTTFALPDLRGRFPLGFGQGPGLTDRQLGEMGGEETVTQTVQQMAPHNHSMLAVSAPASHIRPQGRYLAKVEPNTPQNIYHAGPPDVALSPTAITVAGGGQPQDNMSPYTGLNFIICVYGIFPSRN
jgi:microcystin-dependent protein